MYFRSYRPFQPHHYTDRGNFGGIYNKEETLWCGWIYTERLGVKVYNDPITQHAWVTRYDLEYARTWLVAKLLAANLTQKP